MPTLHGPVHSSFNSRPHKEVDVIDSRSRTVTKHLSIHDLTRRSTLFLCFHSCAPGLSIHDLTRRSTCPNLNNFIEVFFQFTTSQGGRLVYCGVRDVIAVFQFTTSQGGRRGVSPGRPRHHSFNSRPHKEVDEEVEQLLARNGLSIHDLTRRSTTPR